MIHVVSAGYLLLYRNPLSPSVTYKQVMLTNHSHRNRKCNIHAVNCSGKRQASTYLLIIYT